MTKNTLIPTEFQDLVADAISKWAPGSTFTIQKDLVGGSSSALVFLIDIIPTAATSGSSSPEHVSGEFILKLDKERTWDEPEPSESERHLAAEALNENFAALHIPRLLHHLKSDQRVALLYEIAGFSLVGLVTADNLDAGALQQRSAQVAQELLTNWNCEHELQQIPAQNLLMIWLGYRLDKRKAPDLHRFVLEETGGGSTYVAAGRLLVNPLWFCTDFSLDGEAPTTRFTGMIHGDLHPGNLLLERQDPRSQRFWLIDFALSRKAPLFYDHAYLELALMLHHLEGAESQRIIGILEAVDSPEGSKQATMVPMADLGLVKCLRSMRLASEEWQQANELHRRDPFLAQNLLARVAVSLNWCNKNLSSPTRRLSLTYGAWNAWKYCRMFHDDAWQGIVFSSNAQDNGASPPLSREPDTEVKPWTEVWDAAQRFDSGSRKYILLTGRISTPASNLASLGLLPWSAIIDLDPRSDEDGLYAASSPLLKRLRSLSLYGRTSLPVDFDRGTAWLMAGGWPSRHEPEPTSMREWRRTYLPAIRNLCSEIHRAISPQPVTVMVLPGEGLTEERLARALEAVDEGLGDLSEVLVLAPDIDFDEALVERVFAVDPAAFIAGIRNMYGCQDEIVDPQVPGADGPVSIALEHMRNLEEDLDVLHSRVLTEEAMRPQSDGEFWRGMPPTWTDLHAGVDIIREIHPRLIEVLKESLGQSRNLTIEFHHSPGAGGTTAALRAAWTLKTMYPTAVLRRISKLTVDRVDQLFQLAQQPVLLIADASVIPASTREELYRGFAVRNSRVVMLYVIRTMQVDLKRPLCVADPMTDAEAKEFARQYSKRTDSHRRRQQLETIATSTDEAWKRYRSPFFYGLFTYEREFWGVERFVQRHTKHLHYKPRQTLLYLALITRYCQIGIDESILLSLLGMHTATRLDIAEGFGSAPARLLLKRDRKCRMLHPLIAEEVLRQLLGYPEGDSWKAGLKDLSLDFIRDVVRIAGNEASIANRLFVQLFIQRDIWYERTTRGRPRFSELITDIPTAAGQHQVLKLLTELCPDEAHYWNHLGRHHYYEMRQDFTRAEKYLQKAIELSPDDSYHHHSLGMTRRFWIEDKLADMLRQPQEPLPETLLDEVTHLTDLAINDFTTSRRLNPDDEHGYITHTQLILHIAERLIQASGPERLTAAIRSRGQVANWIERNLVVAEDLLSRLEQLRTQRPASRYELSCISQLSEIYGDFDHIIKEWERLLMSEETGQADLRRVLARAYHARRNHSWSSLPVDELRRVVGLMESNLREDPTNERDVRTWFQTYRRLPEFSYLEATDRLGAWASRSNSFDAYYYLYILHYLRLLEGVSRSEELVVDNIEECKKRAKGRRQHSYEWLGIEPKWCPLVHHRDLGQWDRHINFYRDTELLAKMTGTIETIRGPQAGYIRLGQKIRAFFVPGTRQRESKDINAVVHFYLGFSYEGLRAWSVELAPASVPSAKEGGPLVPHDQIATHHVKDLEENTPDPGTHQPSDVLQSEVERPSLEVAVAEFIAEQVASAEQRNEELLLSILGQRLSQKFPGQPLRERLRFQQLSEFVESISGLEVAGKHPRLIVRRIDEQVEPMH